MRVCTVYVIHLLVFSYLTISDCRLFFPLYVPFFFFYFIFSGLRTFFRQQKCVVEPRQALMCMRTHNKEKEKNKLNVTQPKNTLIYIYMLSLKEGRH